ncbi:LTA synthase family protein [Candidatus Saccharibacteria bacterium]|nr:LTA synthase family protein [Candidatus Saccharibacteria bacterium]
MTKNSKKSKHHSPEKPKKSPSVISRICNLSKKSLLKIRTKITNFYRRDKFAIFIAANILFVLLAAIAIMFFVQISYEISASEVSLYRWNFFDNPNVVRYTIILIAAMLVFLTGVFGSTIIATATLFSTFIVIMFINAYKFQYRGAPLLPEDFLLAAQAASLVHFVHPLNLIRLIATVLIVIALAITIQRYLRRRFFINRFSKKTRLITRTLMIAISATFLIAGTDFIRNNQGLNYERNEFLNTYLVAWNQNENYDRNGFIIGFIYNLHAMRILTPEGYSAQAVADIIAYYQRIADIENAARPSLADSDINIIFVMNESFFDPSIVSRWYPFTGGNPTPNLHAIQQHPRSAHGWHFSQDFGGGTANIEFEALTSLTNFFANVMPFVHFASRRPIPSIASHLRDYGFTTTGIHSFHGTMYKRNLVYPLLGFQYFFDESDFPDDAERFHYISDGASYDLAMDIIENSDTPQFINLVTMQNHSPFVGRFPTHQFQSHAQIDPHANEAINNYLESLSISDAALGQLIDRIDASDQRIALVFWGDHAPGIFGHFWDESYQYIHRTPLFFYANFDTPNPRSDLGTISSNFILTAFFDFLGVQKPPLHFLLDEVKADFPILARPNFRHGIPHPLPYALTQYELLTYHFISTSSSR